MGFYIKPIGSCCLPSQRSTSLWDQYVPMGSTKLPNKIVRPGPILLPRKKAKFRTSETEISAEMESNNLCFSD